MLSTLKQALLWILSINAVVIPTSLLTLYIAGFQPFQHAADPTVQEPEILFGVSDAAAACEVKADKKFEGQLRYSNVDWHSTRFQSERNVYVVVLNGGVGPAANIDKATIYCYVNPVSEIVTYFKAYDDNSKPMLNRGVQMDSLLQSF